MTARAFFSWLVLVSMAASLAACGDDDNDTSEAKDAGGDMDAGPSEPEDDAGPPDGEVEDGDQEPDVDGGQPDADAATGPSEWCGDKVVQEDLGEQCDDGNNNDYDGCTQTCEFSCEDDDDCDNLDICDGEESCNLDDHICVDGENPEDGTECGVQSGCRSGVCLPFLCGDSVYQETSDLEEECDDGNLENDDGCTTLCQFTCVSTDSSRDCSSDNPCAAPMACDDDEHVCEEAGSAPAEKTLCDNDLGWCIKGECVPYECGDGVTTGVEECDEGDQNGEPQAGCSLRCKIVSCGNGDIESDEECDDGNRTNLDGCDSSCRAEAVFRLTRMDIVQGPAPEFCHEDVKANVFGSVFGGQIEMPGAGTIDLMQMVNRFLLNAIGQGDTNALIQFLDVEDRTGRTVDDDMRLGIYTGIPAQEWPETASTEPPLDFSFKVEARGVGPDNQPTSVMPAKMQGGGLNQTTEPRDVDVASPMGRFYFKKAMAQSVIDVLASSRPPPPPEVANSVLIPRAFGQGDSSLPPAEYRPRGRLCGAVSVQSMAEIPVGQEGSAMQQMPVAMMCCPDAEITTDPYVECVEGRTLPDCSSFYDLVRGGCIIYRDRMMGMFEAMMAGEEATPDCSAPAEGEEFRAMLMPTEPDVDTDGDGKADAYSTVIGFEGNRVKIVGIQTEDEE